MLQSEPDNQAVGLKAPMSLADEPIPVEFYQWLYSIEKDVRVWDMTPNEIVRLRAALRHHESPTLDAVQREAVEGLVNLLQIMAGALQARGEPNAALYMERAIAEITTLKHDLERQMNIANAEANEAVALRAETEALLDLVDGLYRKYATVLDQGDVAVAQAIRTRALSTKGADHAEQG